MMFVGLKPCTCQGADRSQIVTAATQLHQQLSVPFRYIALYTDTTEPKAGFGPTVWEVVVNSYN